MKLLLVKFLTPSEIDCKVILLIGIRLYTSAIFYARIFGMIKLAWCGFSFCIIFLSRWIASSASLSLSSLFWTLSWTMNYSSSCSCIFDFIQITTHVAFNTNAIFIRRLEEPMNLHLALLASTFAETNFIRVIATWCNIIKRCYGLSTHCSSICLCFHLYLLSMWLVAVVWRLSSF